jgi:hypothetical protein
MVPHDDPLAGNAMLMYLLNTTVGTPSTNTSSDSSTNKPNAADRGVAFKGQSMVILGALVMLGVMMM